MSNRGAALGALVLGAGLAAPAAGSPHDGYRARCSQQSSAGFPGAYTSRANLRVGPLSMIGAGRPTSAATVRRFGGNKFPLIVKAGHTVTVRVLSRSASLYYAIGGGGVLTQTRVDDGRRKITFTACKGTRALSRADGERATFWSGFVVVAKPMCVPLSVWIDRETAPRRARIALGRRC